MLKESFYLMISSISNKESLKIFLKSVSDQDFEVQKVFESDFFSGVAVVKNSKLAGRLEDIKFLESVELDLKEQFEKEAKILSAIQHENIPRVYDLLEKEDTIFFRSQHIEGYSLKEVLKAFKERNEHFPKNVASTIILKLMKALDYTHNEIYYNGEKRSITHRDIKPSNIILSVKNHVRSDKVDDKFLNLVKENKVEPYLIDFGIARFKEEAKDNSGTTTYLSPAQAGHESKQDWRTDIYQLFLVYSEIILGRQLFDNLGRSEIISRKKNYDFVIPRKYKVSKSVKNLIEKGMKRNPKDGFKSEKAAIKSLSKVNSRQKKVAFVKKNKKPIISLILIVLVIALSIFSYHVWDYQVRSVDALVRDIENNPNPTIEELEDSLHKIQKRAFEKKYYEPLLRGEFQDKETGELFYPSHLNADGEWVFVGSSTEEAGAFVGLLFSYSEEYPEILNYAIEYAEPILNAEFDGASSRRFAWALIPAYEVTGYEWYLEKLVDVAEELEKDFTVRRKGMMQSIDLYHLDLFLWLYQETGEDKYLDFSEDIMGHYLENNIDDDGYVFEFSMINATSPMGPVPDSKQSKLVSNLGSKQIGTFVQISDFSDEVFKNITGIFSRDFGELLLRLDVLYEITNNTIYSKHLTYTSQYYIERIGYDDIDFLFVSELNEENDIPKDTLGAVKAISFFKEFDEEIYHQKLEALLSSKYVRKEADDGVLSGSIWIEVIFYDHYDETIKNQSLILTDKLFLELE